MSKLPKKLSALIRLAVKDLSSVEKLKSYTVDMHSWHEVLNYGINGEEQERPTCHVCFAGCVLSRTLKLPRNNYFDFTNVSRYVGRRLSALNSIRSGHVINALQQMNYGDVPESARYDTELVITTVTPYDVNKKRFKEDVLKIAIRLEKHGL